MKRIGIDIMGGDNSPNAQINAAIKFAKDNIDVNIVLFGNKEVLDNYEVPKNCECVYTTEVITNDDEPSTAIRIKKDASITVGSKMLASGDIDAFLSSGSTGALVSAGVLIVKRIKGYDRPSFPIFLANNDKKTIRMYLDMGANVETKAIHMLQNAKLASIYAKYVLNINNPSVSLLNIGSEEKKGNTLYKESHGLLKEDSTINFVGNVEGYDLLSTDSDIVVMDGFTGNVVLKTIEGNMVLFKEQLSNIFKTSIIGKISALLLKSKIKKFKDDFDPNKVGGTPILGINNLIIKAHGSASEEAFLNAIHETNRLIDVDLINKLKEI